MISAAKAAPMPPSTEYQYKVLLVASTDRYEGKLFDHGAVHIYHVIASTVLSSSYTPIEPQSKGAPHQCISCSRLNA